MGLGRQAREESRFGEPLFSRYSRHILAESLSAYDVDVPIPRDSIIFYDMPGLKLSQSSLKFKLTDPGRSAPVISPPS